MTKSTRRKRITQALVERARPEHAGYIIWDSDITGFGLRVTPTGRKSYILKYRVGTGRKAPTHKPTLGRHPEMLCAAAREMAARWKLEASAGRDPSKERQRARTGMTMGELWQRHCETHRSQAQAPVRQGSHRPLGPDYRPPPVA